MTNKKNQNEKKTPISIYFSDNQLPEKLKNNTFQIYSSFKICKTEERIMINLDKLSKLNQLQKNFELISIGLISANFCNFGNYFVDFFGCEKSNLKNFFLGWNLANYRFQKFKSKKKKKLYGKIFNEYEKEIKRLSDSYFFIRDIINTPANIMGPMEIFKAAKKFLKNFELANFISGKKLESMFPLISVVGQGADEKKKPIFCEFVLKKKKSKKKIFLIGKGVSFDTGGLNIKTGSGMSLMKKDMGGAANCIGLAKLISDYEVDVDVSLLLCLVENSISKKSFRPSDIIKSRNGSFVEIGDTDAEGRLILADAISYASEKKPDLIIDMATLTGASRVAMGLEIPSFFCNNDDLAMNLIDSSKITGDPVWQLPLWYNYANQLKSNHADFRNIGNSMFGGAITAALFLEKFVERNIPWIHVDLMAWTKNNYYEGGEAMGIRALLNLIKKI